VQWSVRRSSAAMVLLGLSLAVGLCVPVHAAAQARAVDSDVATATPTVAAGAGTDAVISSPDRDDSMPPNGLGLRIAGWIALGAGAQLAIVGLAACWVMTAPVPDSSAWKPCYAIMGGMAAVSVTVGAVLLVVGYEQRANRLRWMERRGLALLTHTRFAATRTGLVLGYSAAF